MAPTHSNRTQPVPSRGRARQEGEGSVATESQERPRDPPPAPPRSRPRPHLPQPAQSRPGGGGQACWEAARTRLDRGPAPRASGRRAPARLQFQSRTGRTLPPAGLRRRGKPGPPPVQATVPRGGQAHSRRPASHARGGGLQRAAPRPSGRRRPAGRGGDSLSRTRPFAPNRGTNSGLKSIPLISERPPSSRTCVRWPNNAGAGRRGGEARARGWVRRPWPPRPRPAGVWPPVGGAHTHTVRPGAGRWPFLLSG